MPVSKKPQKRTPKHRTHKVSNIGLVAGAAGALRALKSMMTDGSVDNHDLVELQGFFWGYTLAMTRAGIEPPCDVPWVNRMLNKIEYAMPVSSGEIAQLHHYTVAVLEASKRVRSMRIWMGALNDMETYAILHGWKWAGITERKVA